MFLDGCLSSCTTQESSNISLYTANLLFSHSRSVVSSYRPTASPSHKAQYSSKKRPSRFAQDDTPEAASFDAQLVLVEMYWSQGPPTYLLLIRSVTYRKRPVEPYTSPLQGFSNVFFLFPSPPQKRRKERGAGWALPRPTGTTLFITLGWGLAANQSDV